MEENFANDSPNEEASVEAVNNLSVLVELQTLKDDIISNFLDYVGKTKDEIIAKDMVLLERIAIDSAGLTLRALGGKPDETEIKIITASLANLAFVEYSRVSAAKTMFWKAVERASQILLSSLIKVALASIT